MLLMGTISDSICVSPHGWIMFVTASVFGPTDCQSVGQYGDGPLPSRQQRMDVDLEGADVIVHALSGQTASP